MAKSSFPSNVHVLKPRAMSLSDRLDAFLEKHALVPNDAPVRCDPTRPRARGINAISCASCKQAEYLTRDYCRCGHYLRGQLEDEFLAWADGLDAHHNNLAETAMSKVETVRLLFPLSLPLLLWPPLSLAYGAGALSIYSIISFSVGFSLIAIAATIESILLHPVNESKRAASQVTFQTFMEERMIIRWENTSAVQAIQDKKDASNG